MSTLSPNNKVILIGGSSHAGKSTLAQAMAAQLGWQHRSTDSLARHPGRPWRPKAESVPAHVAEHYLSLSVEELLADVLRHYKGLWPQIEAMISGYATNGSGLVLEGSALWPESVAGLNMAGVTAVWLTASKSFFQQRIYQSSGFAQASEHERAMIQKFLERTQLYNERMITAVTHLALPTINIENSPSLPALINSYWQTSQSP